MTSAKFRVLHTDPDNLGEPLDTEKAALAKIGAELIVLKCTTEEEVALRRDWSEAEGLEEAAAVHGFSSWYRLMMLLNRFTPDLWPNFTMNRVLGFVAISFRS